jgi:hypothetical protein
MQYQDIITIEPGKRGGKPCIRGMRITVYDVLEYLASGMSQQEILDQNLSPRLVSRLVDRYPDSNHVYPLGLDRVPDHEVHEYARSEGFLLVTKDTDFSDLCMLCGFPPKGIWIR